MNATAWARDYIRGFAAMGRMFERGIVPRELAESILKMPVWSAYQAGRRAAVRSAFGD